MHIRCSLDDIYFVYVFHHAPTLGPPQVAILLVGSVASFVYMMALEIFNSIKHAHKVHVMKTISKGRRRSTAAGNDGIA